VYVCTTAAHYIQHRTFLNIFLPNLQSQHGFTNTTCRAISLRQLRFLLTEHITLTTTRQSIHLTGRKLRTAMRAYQLAPQLRMAYTPSYLWSPTQHITALRPVLISRVTEARRLSWPGWLGVVRLPEDGYPSQYQPPLVRRPGFEFTTIERRNPLDYRPSHRCRPIFT